MMVVGETAQFGALGGFVCKPQAAEPLGVVQHGALTAHGLHSGVKDSDPNASCTGGQGMLQAATAIQSPVVRVPCSASETQCPGPAEDSQQEDDQRIIYAPGLDKKAVHSHKRAPTDCQSEANLYPAPHHQLELGGSLAGDGSHHVHTAGPYSVQYGTRLRQADCARAGCLCNLTLLMLLVITLPHANVCLPHSKSLHLISSPSLCICFVECADADAIMLVTISDGQGSFHTVTSVARPDGLPGHMPFGSCPSTPWIWVKRFRRQVWLAAA